MKVRIKKQMLQKVAGTVSNCIFCWIRDENEEDDIEKVISLCDIYLELVKRGERHQGQDGAISLVIDLCTAQTFASCLGLYIFPVVRKSMYADDINLLCEISSIYQQIVSYTGSGGDRQEAHDGMVQDETQMNEEVPMPPMNQPEAEIEGQIDQEYDPLEEEKVGEFEVRPDTWLEKDVEAEAQKGRESCI